MLQGGAVEQSKVNISQEFSNLIIAQRAFETTQETINLIH
jgi:flagellar hook protein FlgE